MSSVIIYDARFTLHAPLHPITFRVFHRHLAHENPWRSEIPPSPLRTLQVKNEDRTPPGPRPPCLPEAPARCVRIPCAAAGYDRDADRGTDRRGHFDVVALGVPSLSSRSGQFPRPCANWPLRRDQHLLARATRPPLMNTSQNSMPFIPFDTIGIDASTVAHVPKFLAMSLNNLGSFTLTNHADLLSPAWIKRVAARACECRRPR